jgi:hypothetical protein
MQYWLMYEILFYLPPSPSLYHMLLTAWQHLPIFAGCGDLAYCALEGHVYVRLQGKSICYAQQSQPIQWIHSLTATTVNRHHSSILCIQCGELQNILTMIASTLDKIQTGYFPHTSTAVVHKLWSSVFIGYLYYFTKYICLQ